MTSPNLQTINDSMKNHLAGLLGIQFTELGADRVQATMPVTERLHQPMGLLHGGASMTLAETIASMGGWFGVAPEGKVVVGMEINANHLRQVRSGLVTGIGIPLHRGKNTQVWEVKIFDEQNQLICISRCTLAILVPH